MKITFSEAIKQGIVSVSKSKLHDDANKHKFSWTTDNQGKRVVDVAELERYYGKLSTPTTDSPEPSELDTTGHLTETLQSQVDTLKAELAAARESESRLLRTNQKLVDMLFDVQAENRTLTRQNGKPMLPPSPPRKRWWERFRTVGFF